MNELKYATETPLWAAAQASLAKAGSKKLKYTDEDGISHHYEQGDWLDSCHPYGPSRRNAKIEPWWRQLRGGATDRWIAFFNGLASHAIFRDNDLADQIAMDLYHATNDPNWGVSHNQDDNSFDQQLLRDMLTPLESINIETLLPIETEAWCNQPLKEIGFKARLDLEDEFKRPYVDVFIQLQDLIEQHQRKGYLPILQLTPVSLVVQ
ncbi:hypothetical protein E5D57_001649 [Metarhizium anisopliae]|nr:hypothetical protein E5D57_001649 [Metarhizium anisopliae]